MLENRTYGTAANDNNTLPALIRYIYSNHLQSASLELDEKAEIISYEEYHPYGTSSYQAMSDTISAVAKRYRYTGKERDEESGLYYHGARYYVPWLCRWSASDPLEAKFAGRTPYCYGANNPVSYNDPDGRQERKDKSASSATDKGGGVGVGTNISWGMGSGTIVPSDTVPLNAYDGPQVRYVTVAPKVDQIYYPSSELGDKFYYYKTQLGWINTGIGSGSPYRSDFLNELGLYLGSEARQVDAAELARQTEAQNEANGSYQQNKAAHAQRMNNPAYGALYTFYQLSGVSTATSAAINYRDGNYGAMRFDLAMLALPIVSKPIGNAISAVEKNIVYRVIRADENIALGLAAKNPNATYEAAFHVSSGSRYSTQFISTTKELSVAEACATKTGNRIVEIDLSKVEDEVFDLTNKSVLDRMIKHPIPRNLATKSQEVLIKGFIPPQAITQIK